MGIDPRYIAAVDLCPYFVDKTTGEPLANGVVSFWQDDSRTTPKLVYQLTGAPPNYTYTALPNPITLSNTGTFQDNSGNNIAVYYFPYDSQLPDANVQLYYITVTNSLGTQQFTREAWPNISDNQSQTLTQANISNALTNPQFAQVLFNPASSYTISTSGAGTLSVNIAPGWSLNITTSAAGSVTVTRNSIAGSTAYPYNPPYTLTVAPGASVTNLTLSQRLYNNPSIWSPKTGGINGFIATSVLLAPLSSLNIDYAPSTGAAQGLLTANNTLGFYSEFRNTIQLNPAANTDTSNAGYVDIVINLPTGTATTLSNIQVVGLETDEQNVTYDQTSVNRQIDYMFHYYNPLLQYKPISSYLCGWDFPLNPAQALGSSISAQAIGANKSFYAWDQTIVFQKTDLGVTVSRGSNGELVLTASITGVQPAIIQYLDGATAREMLNSRMSSAIESKTSVLAGVTATISLWYCTDASLPNVASGTNNSIVATLDANGKPATLNGTWMEVPRSNLGNAQFTVTNNTTTNFNLNGFSGWDMHGAAGTQSANFFAIVVGFGAMTAGDLVSINSVSVVPGDIPTRPAPQSVSTVLEECQRYYEKSFDVDVVPAWNLGFNLGMYFFEYNGYGGTPAPPYSSLTVPFKEPKRMAPSITFYNPSATNNEMRDIETNIDFIGTQAVYTCKNLFAAAWTGIVTPGSVQAGDSISFYWTADARLGVV